MEELLRTNNLVLISFAESLLREAGLSVVVFDQNMSVLEGSLGILPRRLMVDADHIEEARTILTEAGIADDLVPRPKGGR